MVGESRYGRDNYGVGNYSRAPYHYLSTDLASIVFTSSVDMGRIFSSASSSNFTITINSPDMEVLTGFWTDAVMIAVDGSADFRMTRNMGAAWDIPVAGAADITVVREVLFDAAYNIQWTTQASLSVLIDMAASWDIPVSFTVTAYIGDFWQDDSPLPRDWTAAPKSSTIWVDDTPSRPDWN